MTKYIIKKPVITEKSLDDAARGEFTFEVDKSCNKQQARKAIEEMFKVHVVKTTSVIIKGKYKKAGKKRINTKRPDKKKIRVKLRSGEKIDLFEVGQTK